MVQPAMLRFCVSYGAYSCHLKSHFTLLDMFERYVGPRVATLKYIYCNLVMNIYSRLTADEYGGCTDEGINNRRCMYSMVSAVWHIQCRIRGAQPRG